MAGPPPVTLPPPAASKKKTKPTPDNVYRAMLKKHPEFEQYNNFIIRYATLFKLDPVYLLGLLITEGGASNPGPNKQGAAGVAQIKDPTISKSTNSADWGTFIGLFPGTKNGSKTKPQNVQWSIAYAAWRLKGALYKNPDINAAYVAGYNPNFKGDSRGKNLQQIAGIPAGYVPLKGTSVSPADTAAAGANQSSLDAAAKLALARSTQDPWVTWDPKTKKLGTAVGAEPPKNALFYNTPNGRVALSKGQFDSLMNGTGSENGIKDIFHAWTNLDPTPKQVANIISHGWSQTTWTHALAQGKHFVGSPVWKATAPALIERARQIYGQGFQVDPKLVTDAIINGWSASEGGVWDAKLRSLKGYTKSNEFKTAYSDFEQTFEQIYGVPTDSDKALISNAVLARWHKEQFGQYLRSRPEFVNSPGYLQAQEAATRSFASWAGVDPVLTQKINGQSIDSAANPYAQTSLDNKVPKDKRIKGNPQTPMGHPSTFIAGNPATPQLNPAWKGIP